MTTSATTREFLDGIGGMDTVDIVYKWPASTSPALAICKCQREAERSIEAMPRVDGKPRVIWAELHGPLDLTKWLKCSNCDGTGTIVEEHDFCTEYLACWCEGRSFIDWVILSGSPDGPTDLAWLRRVIADCRAAGVPVFVRNVGSHLIWMPKNGPCPALPDHVRVHYQRAYEESKHRIVFRDPTGSDPAEWPEDLRVFEYPKCFEEA